MAEMKYVTLDGITYQVRADEPLPSWAEGAEDVAPANGEPDKPEAKEAQAPANKARRSPRSKAVDVDA